MEILINNLKKTFGDKTAVDIPHFHIHSGDMLGLVGNNGAGKTTLFRLILDLLKADEGEARLMLSADSEPSADIEWWKQYTGTYLDESFLIDFLTPEEYFDFVAKVNNVTDDRLGELLASMKDFMAGEITGQKKLIRDYSAGNKQKIGVIAALINSPQLLILDEPFNFLDPSGQNFLKKILLQYHEQTGATILVSSHNLQHTIEISSRIALMEHGHLLKDLPNENQSAEHELEDYFNV